jgi:uncharacterized protein YukE
LTLAPNRYFSPSSPSPGSGTLGGMSTDTASSPGSTAAAFGVDTGGIREMATALGDLGQTLEAALANFRSATADIGTAFGILPSSAALTATYQSNVANAATAVSAAGTQIGQAASLLAQIGGTYDDTDTATATTMEA